MTQAQLASQIGVSHAMIAYYEKNSPSPAVDVAMRCAEALDVPLAALIDENRSLKRVKPGPKSKIDQRIDEVRKLPRKQQELVIGLLDVFLAQHSKKAS